MCFNKRVVAGLAGVAVVLLALSPQLLGRVAPLLVMAVCPLSMVLMMRGMNRQGGACADNGGGDGQRLGELEEEVNRLKAELALRGEDRTA